MLTWKNEAYGQAKLLGLLEEINQVLPQLNEMIEMDQSDKNTSSKEEEDNFNPKQVKEFKGCSKVITGEQF